MPYLGLHYGVELLLALSPTGITIYLYRGGTKKKREEAIALHSEMADFFVAIRYEKGISLDEFLEDIQQSVHTNRNASA